MPDQFFIIGAQRSGTTYLYQMLDQHPDVCMAKPIRPEPKFFISDQLYSKGLEEYRKLFYGHYDGELILGEKSTTYIESPKSADRIYNNFPDCKIIILLRNPIDRAISNYRFSVQNGIESLPFEDALEAEADRTKNFDDFEISTCPFAYVGRGHYINYINCWRERFSTSQILIYISERIFGDRNYINQVFEDLGINKNVQINGIKKRINSTESFSRKIDDEFVAESIITHLKNIFRKSNEALSQDFNIDIDYWEND